jgi:hypothetical protein
VKNKEEDRRKNEEDERKTSGKKRLQPFVTEREI